jgi:hypothetical protein
MYHPAKNLRMYFTNTTRQPLKIHTIYLIRINLDLSVGYTSHLKYSLKLIQIT